MVRTLRPDAVSVAVVDEDGARYEARQVHEGGIFEATLPQQPGDYRIEVTYGDGEGGTSRTRSTTRTAGCRRSGSSTST